MQKHLVCVRYTTGSVCTSDSEKYERYRLKNTVRVFLQRFSETKLLQGSGWSHLKWLGSYVGVSEIGTEETLWEAWALAHITLDSCCFLWDNKNEEFIESLIIFLCPSSRLSHGDYCWLQIIYVKWFGNGDSRYKDRGEEPSRNRKVTFLNRGSVCWRAKTQRSWPRWGSNPFLGCFY